MVSLSLKSFPALYFFVLLFAVATLARPSELAADKPVAFILAGDSTTATKGGWGDGFISIIQKPSLGTNYGKNGRTTVSFKSGGFWTSVMNDVKKYAGKYQVYVTIQFGHNDQKEKAGITISQFQKNLAAMAAQVKSAGGIPVLVTPLTRRAFKGAKVAENLAQERTATIAAAKGGSYLFIDLNAESTRYVNAIGQKAAAAYNLADGDTTHLNKHGGQVFGQMVANLLTQKIPELSRVLAKNDKISSALKAGKPA